MFSSPIVFQRKKGIRLRIKNAVINLIKSSTSHGLPRIFRTDRIFFRFMWTTVLLLSCCECAYLIYDSIFDFLKHDYTTSINTIYEHQSEFPTISFCSYPQPFNESIHKYIVFCRFMGDTSCTYKPETFFEVFKDGRYGICFRFNSGENILNKSIAILKTSLGGFLFGFTLKLKMIPNSYLVYNIHNNTLNPLTISNREMYASVGSIIGISVQKIFTNKLEIPYNQCYRDINLFPLNKTFIDIIKKSDRTYSHKECIEICYSQIYLNHSGCGCKVASIYNIVDQCYFGASEAIRNCSINFLRNNSNNEVDALCKSFCPHECDLLDYSMSAFTSQDLASNNDSLELTVYFPELKYTVVSENPKTEFFGLISNIGGLLGLFIGTSFMSFVEIIEILFEIIFIIYESRISIRVVTVSKT